MLGLERERETVEVPVQPRLRIDSARIVLSACRAGLGIACLPEFLCAADLARRALVRVLPAWQIPSAPVWALSAVPLKQSATVRAFVELVRAHLAAPSRASRSA